jgi:CRP-like cAMP-binding protein
MEILKKIFIEKMGLQESHFNHFCEITAPKTFQKKDYLVYEGKICNFIGYVETGLLRSFIKKDDVEFNNAFYFPNRFFSAYNSFTRQKPAVSFLQAMVETNIRLITYTQLQDLYNEDPIWYKLGKYIADDFFFRKCERETSLLRDSATERYKALLRLHPKIEQLVPQYEIASYLKIKPESLSRIKSLTYIKE